MQTGSGEFGCWSRGECFAQPHLVSVCARCENAQDRCPTGGTQVLAFVFKRRVLGVWLTEWVSWSCLCALAVARLKLRRSVASAAGGPEMRTEAPAFCRAAAIGSAVPGPVVDGTAVGGAAPAVGGAVPVVGGSAAPTRSGGIFIPEWHADWCMDELNHFRSTETWSGLLAWVARNLQTYARQALSVHTSTPCQYKKAPGTSASDLKSCGLEKVIPGGWEGWGHVELHLPHAFAYGDRLAIKYVSRCLPERKAQSAACVELLCYLVVSAPARVRLHPSNWINEMETIAEFRTKAIECGRVIGFTSHSLAWQVPEIHSGQPLQPSVLIGAAESLGPHENPDSPAFCGAPRRPAFGGHIDHEAVLSVLRGLKCDTPYLTGDVKAQIPTKVGKALDPLLPKGGLLRFLQQYPNFFAVTLRGGVKHKNKPLFSFTMSPCIHGEELGGSALALTNPAVGGSSGSNDLVLTAVGGRSGVNDLVVPAVRGSSGGDNLVVPAIPGSFGSNALVVPAVGSSSGGNNLVAPAVGSSSGGNDLVVHMAETTRPAAAAAAAARDDEGTTAPPPGLSMPADRPGATVRPTRVPDGAVAGWTVQSMVQYLHAIDLGHLSHVITDNGIDGSFLLECSGHDLKQAGITQLQAKKSRRVCQGQSQGRSCWPAVGGDRRSCRVLK